MAGNNIAVFGIYPSSFDAECGAADLISAAFATQDISVLLSDVLSDVRSVPSMAPEGASAAATGLLEGALGILAGVGALVIPGIGAVVAAGPILAGLAAPGAGGGVGGLMGALVGLGIPEYEARRYESGVKGGGTLLSVNCTSDAQVKRAKQVLNSSGAEHVAASNESRSSKVELAVI